MDQGVLLGRLMREPRDHVDLPTELQHRRNLGEFDPGRLDYVIYTDSVMDEAKQFVVNTTDMTSDNVFVLLNQSSGGGVVEVVPGSFVVTLGQHFSGFAVAACTDHDLPARTVGRVADPVDHDAFQG